MKFTQAHEWVDLNGDVVTVGLTGYAQQELGDIVYVELPILGHQIHAGDEIAVLESTKAAIDLYAPVSGEISAINTELREYPEKINKDPENSGWIYKIKLSNPAELEELMGESGYQDFLKPLS